MLNKLTDLKNNWFFVFFAFLLTATPLLRFSWDIGSLTIVHLLSIAAFLYFINSYVPLKISTNDTLYLLFLLTASVSMFGNGEKSMIRDSLFFLLDCLLVSYLWQYVPLRDKKRLLFIPPLIGFFFSIILIYLNLKNPGLFFTALPPREIFVNPNILAGYLVLALPLSFRFWFGKGKGPAILSAFLFAGIVLTRSRWAILTASCAVFLYILLARRKYWKITAVLAGVSATALICLLSAMKFEQYFTEQAGFFGNRIDWWSGAWNMFAHNPWNGVGWGNFGNYYTVFKTAPGLNTIFAHNILLQMLAEGGFLAPLIFLAIITAAAARYTNTLSRNSLSKHYYTPVFIAVSSFAFLNIMDYGFYVPALSVLFWILLASFNDRALSVRRKPLLGPAIVFPIFIIMSLSLLLPLNSAIRMNVAQRMIKEKRFEEAEKEVRHSIIADPLRSDGPAKLAEIYFARYDSQKIAGFLALAVDAQRAALDKFPENAGYWNDLAWLLWTSGEAAEAAEAENRAVQCNRFNEKYSQNLKYFLRKQKVK
jgi:O-antigen ligase